jgi:hypothetical protein
VNLCFLTLHSDGLTDLSPPIVAVEEEDRPRTQPARRIIITEQEIKEAIQATFPKKAPGRDGMAWWQYHKPHHIFTRILN